MLTYTVLGLQVHSCAQLLTWVLSMRLKSSCFHGKYSVDSAISRGFVMYSWRQDLIIIAHIALRSQSFCCVLQI